MTDLLTRELNRESRFQKSLFMRIMAMVINMKMTLLSGSLLLLLKWMSMLLEWLCLRVWWSPKVCWPFLDGELSHQEDLAAPWNSWRWMFHLWQTLHARSELSWVLGMERLTVYHHTKRWCVECQTVLHIVNNYSASYIFYPSLIKLGIEWFIHWIGHKEATWPVK